MSYNFFTFHLKIQIISQLIACITVTCIFIIILLLSIAYNVSVDIILICGALKSLFFLILPLSRKGWPPPARSLEYLRMAYTMLNGSQFYDNYSTALYVDKFAFVIPLKTYNCEHE